VLIATVSTFCVHYQSFITDWQNELLHCSYVVSYVDLKET